ncbi:hypothetical protein GCM10010387_12290 [Streptomyces inusitatus]|uniref:TROVE domain-containing protein n=1 Tax=Streptomyces inusitatus TaxID=68221 RepID=A0A918UMH2_9ACTN|nr:hypothetical protein [Streptomyces inusitatus]GGZ20853.1 hypothetical protein GCM10010387_12290 [Streptomyces inusitatus]
MGKSAEAAEVVADPVAESLADLVAAEDVLIFVNAAVTATGQREFRSDAAGQQLSLAFLHEYVQVNYRPVYAAALALDINDHNAALIIQRLLRTSGEVDAEQKRREGELIAARLAVLPPQRVYRLFRALRAAKVNNRRTRAIQREWLAARPDLGLDAVKYREGLRTAVRHTHLPPGPAEGAKELGDFLFEPKKRTRYAHPLLEAHRRAHYEQGAVYELPFTVAEGFAARHGVAREVFLERIAPRMTRLERLRTQAATSAVASAPRADLASMPLTRLALYVLSLSLDERSRRREELTGALRASALRAAGPHAGSWGEVAAVLDDSYSSYGSGVKRRRPLAVALGAHYLLAALAGSYRAHWTSGRADALLVRPWGASPVGARILDALEGPPERLVIVSDGWDNAPPGLAGEVLRVWRTRLDPARRTSVVHLNPVYDADGLDVRRLAPSVPTAGVRDAEDLPALVEIAQFAEGRTGLAELQSYLDRRVERFVAARRRQGGDRDRDREGSR